jgi:hypothetical protein
MSHSTFNTPYKFVNHRRKIGTLNKCTSLFVNGIPAPTLANGLCLQAAYIGWESKGKGIKKDRLVKMSLQLRRDSLKLAHFVDDDIIPGNGISVNEFCTPIDEDLYHFSELESVYALALGEKPLGIFVDSYSQGHGVQPICLNVVIPMSLRPEQITDDYLKKMIFIKSDGSTHFEMLQPEGEDFILNEYLIQVLTDQLHDSAKERQKLYNDPTATALNAQVPFLALSHFEDDVIKVISDVFSIDVLIQAMIEKGFDRSMLKKAHSKGDLLDELLNQRDEIEDNHDRWIREQEELRKKIEKEMEKKTELNSPKSRKKIEQDIVDLIDSIGKLGEQIAIEPNEKLIDERESLNIMLEYLLKYKNSSNRNSIGSWEVGPVEPIGPNSVNSNDREIARLLDLDISRLKSEIKILNDEIEKIHSNNHANTTAQSAELEDLRNQLHDKETELTILHSKNNAPTESSHQSINAQIADLEKEIKDKNILLKSLNNSDVMTQTLTVNEIFSYETKLKQLLEQHDKEIHLRILQLEKEAAELLEQYPSVPPKKSKSLLNVVLSADAHKNASRKRGTLNNARKLNSTLHGGYIKNKKSKNKKSKNKQMNTYKTKRKFNRSKKRKNLKGFNNFIKTNA